MLKKAYSFFKIDFEKLKATNQGLPLFVDIVMVILVIINLSLIFFDWSYSYPSFQSLIGLISPPLNQYYSEKIHPNTSYLDLLFVSIFITELLIRWGLAVYRKTYDKWFFYPFIHWYDVLGCIPMSGVFKSFRLFRVVGMVVKLNNLGVIEIEKTYLYEKGKKYYKIVVEELSDKVVTNVLEGVQDEIEKGNPIVQKIAGQVLIPHEKRISEWVNNQLSEVVSLTYYKYRNDLYQYLQAVVKKSVYENPEIMRISLIPGIGKQIALALDSSISNITFNVVDNALEDMSKNKKVPAVEDVTAHLLNALALDKDENAELNELMKKIAYDTIETVKKQMEVKTWKIEELNERRKRLEMRIKEGRGDARALHAKIAIIDQQMEDLFDV